MIPNGTKMPRKRFKLEFKWFILSRLAFLDFLAWVALVALVQFASKWFQVIPNDSKWFKVIPNHLKMIPSLLGLHLLHSFSLRSHAWTFCTCSTRIHMLELIALIQLMLTCWGFLHSITLPVSCSSGFYRYWAPGYLLPLPSVRGRTVGEEVRWLNASFRWV